MVSDTEDQNIHILNQIDDEDEEEEEETEDGEEIDEGIDSLDLYPDGLGDEDREE